MPPCAQHDGAGDGGHAHDGGLAVGDVEGVRAAAQDLHLPADFLAAGAHGRAEFGGDGELAGVKDFFQVAAAFHLHGSSWSVGAGSGLNLLGGLVTFLGDHQVRPQARARAAVVGRRPLLGRRDPR